MIDFDPICATCGKPRSNHPYRHPFKGPSKDDTIEELTAKLAKQNERVKALVDGLECMVYETTSLSPLEGDGAHWCKISKNALAQARTALAAIKEGQDNDR